MKLKDAKTAIINAMTDKMEVTISPKTEIEEYLICGVKIGRLSPEDAADKAISHYQGHPMKISPQKSQVSIPAKSDTVSVIVVEDCTLFNMPTKKHTLTCVSLRACKLHAWKSREYKCSHVRLYAVENGRKGKLLYSRISDGRTITKWSNV